jgi:hypothetical protein
MFLQWRKCEARFTRKALAVADFPKLPTEH